MDATIQRLFDNASDGEHLFLPDGEFEGPFTIPVRCTLLGEHTTLWAEQGPVLTVAARGVVLRGLRADVTGAARTPDGGIAILSTAGDTVAEHVSVLGEVRGFGGEDAVLLPRQISLGDFPADRTNTFAIDVTLACETRLTAAIHELRLSDDTLPAGANRITVSTGIIRAGTSLYGELTFDGAFVRRVYISGTAVPNPAGYTDGKVYPDTPHPAPASVRPAPNPAPAQPPQPTAPVAAPAPIPAPVPPPMPPNPPAPAPAAAPPVTGIAALLRRGQRVPVQTTGVLAFRLACENRPASMDIDGFLFALTAQGRVRSDADFIFFNQTASADGSLQYLGGSDAVVTAAPEKIAPEVARVAVAYAIYGEKAHETFGLLRNVRLTVSVNGTALFDFPVDGMTAEKTMVGFELYRYNGTWKLSAIGAGYNGGMRTLCESYGVQVDD